MIGCESIETLAGSRKCLICGASFNPRSSALTCPVCALTAVLDEPDPDLDTTGSDPVRRFGDFEIIEEIGRGGMAIVYRAQQRSINRVVALKLLQPGRMVSPDEIVRFSREADTIARLEHPNILPLYAAGEHQGQPWCALKWMHGGSLAARPAASDSASFRATANLILKISEAVHHAHQRGILHLDLKPGNILLDSGGEPVVADFGLARALDQDSAISRMGAFFGSPAYTAPEQAATDSRQVTISADIYGLGAILYERLTGRPPFTGKDAFDTLRHVLESEIATPRSLNPQIPLDLETICLKCVEKDPAKRYPTAQALADDLQRFLTNEPVAARPITRTAKLIRWSQRNPALAAAYSLLFALALVLVLGSPLAVYRIDQERRRAEGAATRETFQRVRAEESLYASDMLLAQEALTSHNLGRAVQFLEKYAPAGTTEPDRRGWEWRYLWNETRSDELSTLAKDATSFASVDWSPDGRWIAGLSPAQPENGTRLTTWDAGTRQVQKSIALPGLPYLVRFLRDGELMAVTSTSGEFSVVVWRSGKQTTTELQCASSPGKVAVDDSGSRLAATGRDWVATWNLQTGERLMQFRPPINLGNNRALAIAGDGTQVAYNTFVGTHANTSIVLASTTNGLALAELRGHTDQIFCLAFSHDGRSLSSASFDGTVILWNLETSEPRFRFKAHSSVPSTVAFSPDDTHFATAGWDQQIKLWNTASGAGVNTLKGHQHRIDSLAYSPDGQTLCSGSADRTLRLWNTIPPPPPPNVVSNSPLIFNSQFSPAGDAFATFDGEDGITVWNPTNLTARGFFRTPDDVGEFLAYSPGCEFIALQLTNNYVSIHGAIPLNRVATLRDSTNPISALSFSLDGKFLALGRKSELNRNTITVSDWSREAPIAQIDGSEGDLARVCFSPGGDLLAAGYWNGQVEVWHWRDGQRLARFEGQPSGANRLLFLSDKQRLVSLSTAGGSIDIWDLHTRSKVISLTGQLTAFIQVTESRDGRRLAAGGNDGAITIWELGSYREVSRLRGHDDPVLTLSFLPDGNTLTSVSRGSMRVWRAAPLTDHKDKP